MRITVLFLMLFLFSFYHEVVFAADENQTQQNAQQVMNLGDSSASATDSADSGDVVAQMSEGGPPSSEVDDPEAKIKNQIKQKAMLIRASKVQDLS